MPNKHTIKYAFVKSIPVLISFTFMGIAFGILLQQAGYNFVWAFAMSAIIYAGSLQFVLVSFLSAGTALPMVAVMTLFINSRLMFYGLSFVDKFKKMGKCYPYMVYTITDETSSILWSCDFTGDIDEKKASFLISFFQHIYWIVVSVLGSLLGQWLSFDFEGIDFAMTALFVVILLDQWKSFPSHIPAITGLLSGLAFLVLLGPDAFLLPSLMLTVLILLLCKNHIAVAEPLANDTKKEDTL